VSRVFNLSVALDLLLCVYNQTQFLCNPWIINHASYHVRKRVALISGMTLLQGVM